MSLVCNECSVDLQPSKSLPGREGVLVYPNLLSLVYVPSGNKEKLEYRLSYQESKANRSLCFECIDSKSPEKEILKTIYAAYEAETRFKRVEESQKGKLVSCSDNSWSDAYDEFKSQHSKLKPVCIFCKKTAENGKPFFRAVVIDRVRSAKHISLVGSYSFSNLENGMTNFKICYEDFRSNFPRGYEQLSYDMLGKDNPNFQLGESELHISPEFEKALQEETGKNVKDLIKELVDAGGDLKIIRREAQND